MGNFLNSDPLASSQQGSSNYLPPNQQHVFNNGIYSQLSPPSHQITPQQQQQLQIQQQQQLQLQLHFQQQSHQHAHSSQQNLLQQQQMQPQHQQRYSVSSGNLPASYNSQPLPSPLTTLGPNAYSLSNQPAPLPSSPALSNSSLQLNSQIVNGLIPYNNSGNPPLSSNPQHQLHTSHGSGTGPTNPSSSWQSPMLAGPAQPSHPNRTGDELNQQHLLQQTLSQVITAVGLNADADRANPSHSVRPYDPRTLPTDPRSGLRVSDSSMAGIENAYAYGNIGLAEMKLYKEYLLNQRNLKLSELHKQSNDAGPLGSPGTVLGMPAGAHNSTVVFRAPTPNSQASQQVHPSQASQQRFSQSSNSPVLPLSAGPSAATNNMNGMGMPLHNGFPNQSHSEFLSSPRHNNQRQLSTGPPLSHHTAQSSSSANGSAGHGVGSSNHHQQPGSGHSQLSPAGPSLSPVAHPLAIYNHPSHASSAPSNHHQIGTSQSPSQAQRFLAQLLDFFNKSNRSGFQPPVPPILDGQPIDLFKLFSAVQTLGGSHHVGRMGCWPQVATMIDLLPQNNLARRLSGAAASGESPNRHSAEQIQNLQATYAQYLQQFEAFHIMRRRQQLQAQQNARHVQQIPMQSQQPTQASPQAQISPGPPHLQPQTPHNPANPISLPSNPHNQSKTTNHSGGPVMTSPVPTMYNQAPSQQQNLSGTSSSTHNHSTWQPNSSSAYVSSPVNAMYNQAGVVTNGQASQLYTTTSSQQFASAPPVAVTPVHPGSPVAGNAGNSAIMPTLSFTAANTGTNTVVGTPTESRMGSPGSLTGGPAESTSNTSGSVPNSTAGHGKRARAKKASEGTHKVSGAPDKKKRLKQDLDPPSPLAPPASLPPIDKGVDDSVAGDQSSRHPPVTSQAQAQLLASAQPQNKSPEHRTSPASSMANGAAALTDLWPRPSVANGDIQAFRHVMKKPSHASPSGGPTADLMPLDSAKVASMTLAASPEKLDLDGSVFSPSQPVAYNTTQPYAPPLAHLGFRPATPSNPPSCTPHPQMPGQTRGSPLKGKSPTSTAKPEHSSVLVNGMSTLQKSISGSKPSGAVEYVPICRPADGSGGWNLREAEEIHLMSTNARPRRTLDDLGLVDIRSLVMSLKSRLATEVAYALNTLNMVAPHLRLYRDEHSSSLGVIALPLFLCEDLLEELLDLLEDVVFQPERDDSQEEPCYAVNGARSHQLETKAASQQSPPCSSKFTNMHLKSVSEAARQTQDTFQSMSAKAMDDEARPLKVLPATRNLLDEKNRDFTQEDLRPPLGQVELVFSVLNILRHFAMSEDSGVYIGHNPRTAMLLTALCDFPPVPSASPRRKAAYPQLRVRESLQLTLLEKLRIRREVLQILADVAHGVQLADHSPLTTLSMLKLSLFFLSDSPHQIDRTPIEGDDASFKAVKELSLATQARLRSLSLVPSHVDAGLTLLSKVATIDANRRSIQLAVAQTHAGWILDGLLEVILQLLPITDEEFLLVSTEDEPRMRAEIMSMALFNVVSLQSNSTGSDSSSSRKFLLLRTLVRIIARLSTMGGPYSALGPSKVNLAQVLVERLVETIRVLEGHVPSLGGSLSASREQVTWFGGGFEPLDDENDVGNSLLSPPASARGEEKSRECHQLGQSRLERLPQIKKDLPHSSTSMSCVVAAPGKSSGSLLLAWKPVLMEILAQNNLSQQAFTALAKLLEGNRSGW